MKDETSSWVSRTLMILVILACWLVAGGLLLMACPAGPVFMP